MKKCKCGNTISLDRQREGINNCPSCDEPYHIKKLNDIISDMEYDYSGNINQVDVMKHLIILAKYIKEDLK